MSKPRLIILSDIFGLSTDSWLIEYRNRLTDHFEIIEYDSRALAGISTQNQDKVHGEFVNGGIDRAVKKIIELESNNFFILGFSVGGTIAWKTALQSENIASIFLASATRLRNEVNKPSSKIKLYFGGLEKNGPAPEWFDNFNISPIILKGGKHDFYRDLKVAAHICEELISHVD